MSTAPDTGFPSPAELLADLQNVDASPPPTASGQQDKEKIVRARHGKPKDGIIVDRLEFEGERPETARIEYDIVTGEVQKVRGDQVLLDHFEPGEALERHYDIWHEHYLEVVDGYTEHPFR